MSVHYFLSSDEVETPPVQVPVTKPALNKANPKLGVGTVNFSHDNKYMFTQNGKIVFLTLMVIYY